MLRSVKELHGYSIDATDGSIGKVGDFYFHDDTWHLRYVVVDTGHWLPGRKVLVAALALGAPNWERSALPVSLTREQVEHGPNTATDLPVSRQHEVELHSYYAWPAYWMEPGTGTWPAINPLPYPDPLPQAHGDPHLCSTRDAVGERIHASDGVLGPLRDFYLDDTAWVLRYVAVHIGGWFGGRQVLLATHWLHRHHASDSTLTVNVPQAIIEGSPAFDPAAGISRDDETLLYDYYGRPTYWRGLDRAA